MKKCESYAWVCKLSRRMVWNSFWFSLSLLPIQNTGRARSRNLPNFPTFRRDLNKVDSLFQKSVVQAYYSLYCCKHLSATYRFFNIFSSISSKLLFFSRSLLARFATHVSGLLLWSATSWCSTLLLAVCRRSISVNGKTFLPWARA